MKKALLIAITLLNIFNSYGQQIRFNDELDEFCKTSIKEFNAIPVERKAILEKAAELLSKKPYILFTCQTNSRRTLLLQVWAQTAFYYYGINRSSFSIGDTISSIYPGLVNIFKESGFTYHEFGSEDPKGYIISTSKKYPKNIIVPKKDLGKIDTSKVIIVSICFTGEKSVIASNTEHISIPYESPKMFEKTPNENQKYFVLNKQISIEMFYMAQKTKEYIIKNEEYTK